MVPCFINELSLQCYGVLALGFEPGPNSKALLLRMRQACFRKWKLLILAEKQAMCKDSLDSLVS